MRPDDPTFLTREDHRLPGVKRAFSVPSPAVGQGWAVKVPGGRQWRILSGEAAFQASATVINRFVGLGVNSPDLQVWFYDGKQAVVAGATYAVGWGQGLVYNDGLGAGQEAVFPAPAFWLGPGMTFGSDDTGRQVGDQWSQITLYIEECYADDTQLSEAHLEREQEERALAEHSRAILIGG